MLGNHGTHGSLGTVISLRKHARGSAFNDARVREGLSIFAFRDLEAAKKPLRENAQPWHGICARP